MNVLHKLSAYLYKRCGSAGRKGDHRGLSLVELICAIAIMSLVGAGVSGFMIVGANTYRSGTTEVELQTEAQMIVNQIGDLVIDTTSTITPEGATAATAIAIERSNNRYEIEHAGTEVLYSEYRIDTGGAVAEDQLLGENVTTFQADISDFPTNGVLRLYLKLEKDERIFAAYYTIMARNGSISITSDSVSPSATVVAPNEIVVEPNQRYELNAAVVGVSNNAVTWTLSGQSDPDTMILLDEYGMPYLKVGKNENSNSMQLTVNTVAMDGAAPLGTAFVKVHLRRVNDVTLNGVLTSGTAGKQNATYRITASIDGTTLDRLLGSESDMNPPYYSPYELEWTSSLSGSGGVITNTSAYFTLEDHGTYADLKLLQDFDDLSLTVYARDLHPEGTYGGVQRNKTGLSYDTVIGEWTLQTGLRIVVSGGWLRGGESPMLVEGLDSTGARVDENGNVYVTYGLVWEVMYVPGGTYVHLTDQSNAGGFGGNGELPDGRVLMDTWGGIRSTYTPGRPDDLTEGLLTDFWSYSSPFYNPQDMTTPLSVYKLRLTLTATDIDNVQTATAEFTIPDATLSYRNSNPDDGEGAWSNDKGSHVVYVTPQDKIDTYTSYFMIVDGWATSGQTFVRGDGSIDWDNPIDYNDYVLFNRFVGVIKDEAGYANDARYDLTFMDGNGLMYKNGLVPYHEYAGWDGVLNQGIYNSLTNRLIVIQKEKMTKDELLNNLAGWSNATANPTDNTYQWSHWINSGLNLNQISSGEDGYCTISVYVTQDEKNTLCAGGGTTITEIYEYNPQFCSNNLYEYMSDDAKARAETVDGCSGYLEYHFVQPNVQITNHVGSEPIGMYCPTGAQPGLINGYYYITENARYQVSDTTAYYQTKVGGSFTTQYTLTWNGSMWCD